MTGSVRTDPTLGRASLPGAPAPLGTSEAPVVRAAAAGPAPVLLEGERVALLGSERGGLSELRVDGRTVLSELGTDAGPAANVLVGPATLRRELVGVGASTLEFSLAVPSLPVAALQWVPASGEPEGGLTVELTLLPGARDLRYRVHEAGVRAEEEGTAGIVEVLVHPPPSEWSAEPRTGGGIRVRARVGRASRVTLLAAAGDPERVERALAAATHLGAHETRAAAAADPARAGIAVRTGVREIDHAATWAAARLFTAARRPGGAPAEDLFWSGVGALAAGDHDGAGHLLAGIEPDDPLGVLLAARHAFASGDPGPALERLSALAPGRMEELPGTEAWGAWSGALAALAGALRHAAPERELERLRTAAARPRRARGPLRLPMAGAGAPPEAGWPGFLLGAAARPPGSAPRVLAAWDALASADVEAGYAAWRRSLAEGLDGGPAGRGSWDPVPEPWGPYAPRTGILLATLAHGLLGIAPDAPSGRLGLAPRLPGHVTSFQVGRIRVGDAEVALSYAREGEAGAAIHRFRLEPLSGRVPVMAVLEPSVPTSSPGTVLVDGSAAELECVAEGERTTVRVQLPLDAVRTLEIVGR